MNFLCGVKWSTQLDHIRNKKGGGLRGKAVLTQIMRNVGRISINGKASPTKNNVETKKEKKKEEEREVVGRTNLPLFFDKT
jgi:hypothetical protein